MKKAITLIMALCLVVTLFAGCQPEAPAEHVHTLVHNAEKAPTCVNNGILEHWYCPACNARFSDAEGTTEVTFADLEVEELGHTGGTATCIDQAVCERCEKPYGAALGHTWDDPDATAKTCTVCGVHANPNFAGGKGTAEEPYLIKDAKQLANITNFYESYKYYKVADGVETIDMAGQGKILLNGSFDGNGVKIVNLNTALFLQAGYQNTAADIKISNLDVTMNVTDGCALVRNIFNSGKTTFENVAIHGYIEGLYNMGSFFNYGTANCDGKGANYTVELVKSVSDATIVCTSGNIAAGFFGHTYEGSGNSFTMIIDGESAFNGKILTTNGKGNLYFAMTSDYNNANNHFIINGEEVKFDNGHIPAAANVGKITVVKPTVGESAYEVEAVEGATEFVVYLNAQVTAYDEEGYKITNKAGLTWPLAHFGMDELAEMGLIDSLVIVNGTDHDFGYEVVDGVMTIYSGRSNSYESGNVYLQINQYNAEGELLATGTLTVCTLEHDHTFVGTSCTTDGKCNCGTTQKAPGHAWKDATCTVAKTCGTCGATEGEALGHADANADYKCDSCSTKMLPADGEALTIPQALAIANLHAHNTYTTQKYYITGIVTGLYNTQYGNFYIEDAEGNQICIYGLYSADGKTRYDAMSYKPVNGDEVTVYTVLGTYNSAAQGKNAWLDEVVAHEHNYTSVVTAPTCSAKGFTTHTCSICDGTYTDAEVDALGHTTTSGTCERCGNEITSDLIDKTYSYTFTATQFTANGTKTLNGVSWTLAGDGGYWGWDSNNGKGQQFGSGSKPYKSMTLTSTEFSNVKKITINTSGASSVSANLNVYVGDTLVKTIKITTTATAYEIDVAELSGAVKFEYVQTSSKALYVKSIVVEYAE